MIKLKNTLYLTQQGSYLHKERETLVVEADKKKLLQLPVNSIQQIFCFGNVLVSPFFLGFCGEKGIGVSFFSLYGKFLGRLQGRQSGNILLRKQQYKLAEDNPQYIAKNIIAAKVANTRSILMREIRNHGSNTNIESAINRLARTLAQVQHKEEINTLRGLEGEAAATYFNIFNELIKTPDKNGFVFNGRNRRPPKDPVNALLSLFYSILGKEIASALQGVGLDPQAGFLHTDRPGRDSLAQDILEEFRVWWVDRFVLSVINRKQIDISAFNKEASGAVNLTDDGRKKLLKLYQQKKQENYQTPLPERSRTYWLVAPYSSTAFSSTYPRRP